MNSQLIQSDERKYMKSGLSGGKKIKDIQLSLNSPKCLEMVFYYFHTDYLLSLPK